MYATEMFTLLSPTSKEGVVGWLVVVIATATANTFLRQVPVSFPLTVYRHVSAGIW